nr:MULTISPECIES: hypothetical protein [unclassified Bradyrhizobium]
MQVVPCEEGRDLVAEPDPEMLDHRHDVPIAALSRLQLPQGLLPLERATGIGSLRRDRLVEDDARERRDLFLGQLVRWPAVDVSPPGPLEPQVLLLAPEEGLVVVGGAERDLDFGAVAEGRAVLLRNPPPKLEIPGPWVFSRLEHFLPMW